MKYTAKCSECDSLLIVEMVVTLEGVTTIIVQPCIVCSNRFGSDFEDDLHDDTLYEELSDIGVLDDLEYYISRNNDRSEDE